MANKVEVKLSHPWTDFSNPDKPKAHDTGESVNVDPETAERLVRGGNGVFARKTDAAQAGLPDAPTTRSR